MNIVLGLFLWYATYTYQYGWNKRTLGNSCLFWCESVQWISEKCSLSEHTYSSTGSGSLSRNMSFTYTWHVEQAKEASQAPATKRKILNTLLIGSNNQFLANRLSVKSVENGEWFYFLSTLYCSVNLMIDTYIMSTILWNH